jgi:divalent metal cation (Fe/Co/Zn/Cd) transporter
MFNLALVGAAHYQGLFLYAVAAIIALAIVKEGWDILVSGMRVLLDASADGRTLEKIRALIMEAPKVASLKELVARNSGRYLFVQANLIFRVTDLNRAHLAKGKGLKVAQFLLTYKPDVISCKESLSGKPDLPLI